MPSLRMRYGVCWTPRPHIRPRLLLSIRSMLHKGILAFLGSFLAVLFLAFVGVMSSEYVQGSVGGLLGLSEKSEKNDLLAFLGFAMGGILLAVQAVIANRRAKAMEDTARAQASAARAQARATRQQAKANQNTESGQRQERLRNAIEHLGHSSDSVRLGGAYELFHLAQDTQSLRQTVLDILCSHVRRTTAQSDYRETNKSEPSEEVQSLLTLLFVQDHAVFKGCHINLQGSWLNGASLRNARLEGADLASVWLLGAGLLWARLRGANLFAANLQSAYLLEAQLQGASLCRARLHGTHLLKAQLHGADLYETQLQEAGLQRTELHGVTSTLSDYGESFVERLRAFVGRNSDLSGAILEGGLKQQDLDSYLNGMPAATANELREKLQSHVDKPEGHDLPAKSGAMTGTYTEEDADRWIAEYDGPMSEASNLGTS